MPRLPPLAAFRRRAVRSSALVVLTVFAGAAARPTVAPEPPLGRAIEPPLPLPASSPDPQRLTQARASFGGEVRESTLGGYLLLTDIDDPALVERAERVIGALEAIYYGRYGRRPVGTPREAIVLFSSELDYRGFQAGDRRLAGLTASTGLAGRGIVATFRGPRRDNELLGTLVHELVHLLNRRAIGPALPSWLDEGLADDLGASRIDAEGRLWPGTWSRTLAAHENEIRISGGEAALRDLADVFGPDGNAPGRLNLGAILALEWEDFVAEQSAELHYAAAAAFIRMLLAAPARNSLFRSWLGEVSAGASPAAEELRRALGQPWEELDLELALWTRGELARLPPLRPAGSQVASPRSTPSAPSVAR